MDRSVLGTVRQGQARSLLSDHSKGPRAVDRRAVEMGRLRPSHGPAAQASDRGVTMPSVFQKLRWWLQRRRKEDDLREELQFHLAEEADQRQAEGLTDEQARRAARHDLGNPVVVKEDARAAWSWVLVEQLAQDIRYGLRGMGKNRMFTALAALSLALGIGANTAIYSFMDAILLRSLPVSDPSSLV